MDLPDFGFLFSSLLIGAIGAGIFIYGKKSENPKCLGMGVVLCVFPYFVHSLLLMWGIAAACMAALYLLPRFDY